MALNHFLALSLTHNTIHIYVAYKLWPCRGEAILNWKKISNCQTLFFFSIWAERQARVQLRWSNGPRLLIQWWSEGPQCGPGFCKFLFIFFRSIFVVVDWLETYTVVAWIQLIGIFTWLWNCKNLVIMRYCAPYGTPWTRLQFMLGREK